MKKMISILAVMICIVACKKSPSPEPDPTPTVTIGTQVWMLKNLDVSTYKNGDLIQYVSDQNAWIELTTGAWCWYNNDSATYGATYGKLYNWYAVNDPRGLAPAGYHIPTDAEWTALSSGLGGDAAAPKKMKETGAAHWTIPNTGSTNSSGFTGLPGGNRSSGGTFSGIGANANWWSSTEALTTVAWYRSLGYGEIVRGYDNKRYGFSVRCLKD